MSLVSSVTQAAPQPVLLDEEGISARVDIPQYIAVTGAERHGRESVCPVSHGTSDSTVSPAPNVESSSASAFAFQSFLGLDSDAPSPCGPGPGFARDRGPGPRGGHPRRSDAHILHGLCGHEHAQGVILSPRLLCRPFLPSRSTPTPTHPRAGRYGARPLAARFIRASLAPTSPSTTSLSQVSVLASRVPRADCRPLPRTSNPNSMIYRFDFEANTV